MSTKYLRLEKLDCSRDAPMGRLDILPRANDPWPRLHLSRLPMVDHDYDQGGAYWSGNECKAGPMYVAYGKFLGVLRTSPDQIEQVQIFVRATSRNEAKMKIVQRYKEARFYR